MNFTNYTFFEFCKLKLLEFSKLKYFWTCQIANFWNTVEWISLHSMEKITKGVNKINFTMLYGNYCCIIIENFPKEFSPCRYRSKIFDILFPQEDHSLQYLMKREEDHWIYFFPINRTLIEIPVIELGQNYPQSTNG